MIIKQQINHGAIHKVCHLHNDIFGAIHFTRVTFCRFYSITSPVLLTKNNKLWNEGKEDFLYI